VLNASYDWIVTTDADCFMSEDYLMAYDQFLSVNSSEMIAGPVICSGEDSFLHRFQSLDFLSLQGATMGGFGGRGSIPFLRPFMCNGANLCYKKETFLKLGGFSGNKQLATGDDVFMLEKMLQNHADKVHFIKSRASLVRTGTKQTWKELISQRVRWASKTSSYQNRFAKFVGLLVFLANVSLLFGLFLALFGFLNWSYFGVLFVLKLNVDFLLIFNTASLWGQENVMKSFVASSFIYPFFSFWVAVKAMGGSYEWKGRSFKKGANPSSKE
jgi:cellulose synthase/poly-beta-1,6-N-acetylglucosamine synthase-like glycosyltransferase